MENIIIRLKPDKTQYKMQFLSTTVFRGSIITHYKLYLSLSPYWFNIRWGLGEASSYSDNKQCCILEALEVLGYFLGGGLVWVFFSMQICSDLIQRSVFQRKKGESNTILSPCYSWLPEPVFSLFGSAL